MNGAYIGKLMEIALEDHDVLHLLADSGTGFDEIFRRNFPNQILNFGIGEENMVAAAAGMASVGKKPFVFTAGAFLAYRSMEFIRNDVCFQNLNVKLVGMGSGLSWSSLGPTHHTTEDISVLRAIPNLLILSPATPKQVTGCVDFAYKYHGPVYIKIEMNHEKEFFKENYYLNESGMDVLEEGKDVTIFTTGSILEEVFEVKDRLIKDGLSVKLVNVVKMKPFDTICLGEIIENSKLVFTIEEHNIYGGLGSIVAESISYEGMNVKVVPIGIKDQYALGYGSHKAVRKINCLNSEAIYKKIREMIN